MNFEAFMESIKKHIKEYLPESYNPGTAETE